ncbi:MAG: hypothetical protein ACKV2V_07575 [Blastocatellia bacterium]
MRTQTIIVSLILTLAATACLCPDIISLTGAATIKSAPAATGKPAQFTDRPMVPARRQISTMDKPGSITTHNSLPGNQPLVFAENRGQADPRAALYLQGRDTAAWFTARG